MHTSPSFTPGPSYLVYDGPNTAVVISNTAVGAALVSGTTYYLKAAAYSLIKTGLLASSDYSFVPTAGGGVPVVASYVNLPSGVADGSVYSVKDNNKLYRYDTATGWLTWVDGSDLLSASVTAGKITTANLSAISANMGSITAGSITLDAGGFIKGGQSAYNTGAGFWLGYSGGYKFSLGNPATSYLNWDGANLNIASPQFSMSGGNATFSGTLGANVVKAGNIEAGAVTADKIDSNGLSIKDANGNVILESGGGLMVGDNLVRNPDLANNDSGWAKSESGNMYHCARYVVDAAGQAAYGAPWNAAQPFFYINANDATGVGYFTSDAFPVDATKNYCISAYARLYAGAPTAHLGLVCYNAAGAVIDSVYGSGLAAFVPAAQWTRYSAVIGPNGVAFPAGTRTARLIWIGTYLAAGGTFATRFCVNAGVIPTNNVTPLDDSRLSAYNKITSGNASTYIADLAVDTLQIAGNAVTLPISSTNTGQGTVSATIVSTGGKIQIVASASALFAAFYSPENGYYGGGGTIQLLRGGTVLLSRAATVPTGSANFNFFLTFTYSETPGAGTWTYSLRVLGSTYSSEMSQSNICLLETKK